MQLLTTSRLFLDKLLMLIFKDLFQKVVTCLMFRLQLQALSRGLLRSCENHLQVK